MSLYAISMSNSLCFAQLIKPHLNFDQDVDNLVSPRKGVKVQIYGYTSGTEESRQCGNKAIGDLLPWSFQINKSVAYSTMIQAFEKMGYVSGVNLQSIPYNYYYSFKHNELNMTFRSILERMKFYTGKKVTLVAHSMGNMNVMHQLSKMSQEEKDTYIHSYVPIAAPFLGSVYANKVLVGGDQEFSTLFGLL